MHRYIFVVCGALSLACQSSSGRDDPETTLPVPGDTGAPTTGAVTPTGSTGASSSSGTDAGEATTVDGGPGSESGPVASTGGPSFDVGGVPDMPGPPLPLPQLWYSIEDLLVYIELDPADGGVTQLVTSTISNDPTVPGDANSCSLTMLADGSLLGGRGTYGQTRLFHIAQPPTVAGAIAVTDLGVMPESIYIEALYTDCDGRVYLMDTGDDNSTNTGNRLLRFTGDYLAGDLAYEVITDLTVAVSADIDDMGPGIDAGGSVIDNPGLGIDSGSVYSLDYTTGTGAPLGKGGSYGIHSLGGPLFADDVSRLYLLDLSAQVFEADPTTLALSPVLATGPKLASGNFPGNTGLAGPLTDCKTGFPQG